MLPEDFDQKRQRFPLCLTWTTIPFLSWLFPCLGHVGIAGSDGMIRDFQGPFTIGVDNFAFGRVLKYVPLRIQRPDDVERMDQAIFRGSSDYQNENWVIWTNNCHSHVARCLNYMGYQNSKWHMSASIPPRFMSEHPFRAYLPFTMLALIVAAVVILLCVPWK
ncbi:putative transmembrane protein [Paratrimastix pyriformis]|uniref:Transmembrane protein n=1 Tax=Paratrimastix pyriformis TaxID=342808 RepID=A0ABQ8U8W9_9EUKA|nr:putative transmembrane protein [Paratrimastix pyriformis]